MPWLTDIVEKARAAALTGVKGKTALVRMGLQALIARESARRLAALERSEKELERLRAGTGAGPYQ